MSDGDTHMMSSDPKKSRRLGSGDWNARVSPKKFMPKKPTRNDIGMNMTVTIVSVFMMSLVRFDMTER